VRRILLGRGGGLLVGRLGAVPSFVEGLQTLDLLIIVQTLRRVARSHDILLMD
jgi:hypothetical protein